MFRSSLLGQLNWTTYMMSCGRRASRSGSRVSSARTKQPARWSSTTPHACIMAYTVVAPTNRKPRRLNSLASAADSGVDAGSARDEGGAGRRSVRPDQLRERGVPERQHGPPVGDGRLDLGSTADDRGVPEQPRHVRLAEGRHLGGLEVREGETKGLALAQDGQPRQARLEPLEAELLEQTHVVVYRPAPLGVVVGDVLDSRPGPGAAQAPVRTAAQVVGRPLVNRIGHDSHTIAGPTDKGSSAGRRPSRAVETQGQGRWRLR